MNLIDFEGCIVKIILTNDYYYVGRVISADENSIDFIDKNSNKVSLKKEVIMSIQEIGGKNGF